MAEPTLEHQFNGDLLISEHDQKLAEKQYSEIYHVLDHPTLRDEFQKYDKLANGSKPWVQIVGLVAVFLAAVALIGSAITPLVHHFHDVPPWIHTVLLVAEIGGIIGVFIAVLGIGLFSQKKTWLRARMMAELIRLWHFESLICRGKQIDMSCNIQDKKAGKTYREERDTAFQAFLHDRKSAADSYLRELIENPAEGYEMLHDERTQYSAGSPVIDKIFQAYKAIRFKHQANYAGHKLQNKTDRIWILKWPAAVLQARMQFWASFFLVGSLLCSLAVVIGHFAGWKWTTEPYLPVAIIAFLVLNVAARAVQDGLAGPEEFQRYNDYAGKIAYLKQRFEDAHSPQEKLDLMVEMERAALEELKGFLRAHDEAKFIL